MLNTRHYKVMIKGKVEQSREWSSAFPNHLGVVAIETGAFGSSTTTAANFTYIYIYIYIYKTHKLHWNFDIQTDHVISTPRPDCIIINNNNNKKRTCTNVDLAVQADHKVKLKENEKKDKYLGFSRELKKVWNMKVTIIQIVIGALGIGTKGLVKGQEGFEIKERMETIQTTALLRSARILRRVLETWWNLLSLKLQKNHQLTLVWKTLKE